MRNTHKMQDQGKDQELAYLDRMAKRAAIDPSDPIAASAARCRALLAAAAVPEVCGDAIRASRARGSFVLVENVELLPVGTDKVMAVHRGYGGRSAIRRADVFDAMLAAAARRKQPAPLTPGQIAVGRRYHDLVAILSADGTKLSSLQGGAGGAEGRDWMDRHMALSHELDSLQRRIGIGPAMIMRRIRPSQRGRALREGEVAPKIFTRRDLVDAVCVRDMSINRMLVRFGWSDSGRNKKAASQALSTTLDAMVGYGRQKTS